MIKVYYVKGLDQAGRVVELAKFFRPEPAKEYCERFSVPMRQPGYREVGIVIAEESEDAQHPAHRGGKGVRAAWE